MKSSTPSNRSRWTAAAGAAPTTSTCRRDYHHVGRAYPVLLVLHNAGEKPAEALKRWKALAAESGYLLVAPAWGKARARSTAIRTVSTRR